MCVWQKPYVRGLRKLSEWTDSYNSDCQPWSRFLFDHLHESLLLWVVRVCWLLSKSSYTSTTCMCSERLLQSNYIFKVAFKTFLRVQTAADSLMLFHLSLSEIVYCQQIITKHCFFCCCFWDNFSWKQKKGTIIKNNHVQNKSLRQLSSFLPLF